MSDSDVAAVRSSAVAALGLGGGFLAGRLTGRRDLGGALFAAAALGARGTGIWPAATAGLTALYLAAMAVLIRWLSASAHS